MTQPGPRYDNAMKALCARAPAVLCRWLGIPVHDGVEVVRLSELAPKATTRQTDALLLIGGWLVVQIEFQTAGEPLFGWRMLEYRTLLARRKELTGMTLVQHAVVLGPGRIDEGVHDNQVDFAFDVHYLRHRPVAPLLEDPALAPFAVLADLSPADRALAFRNGLDVIATVADSELRWVLAQVALDLADIRLDLATIRSTWEDSAMPVPSFLEKLERVRMQEGLEKGLEKGREQGREEGREEMVTVMLRHRFGSDPRTPAIARRLAKLEPEVFLQRFEQATGLDQLID